MKMHHFIYDEQSIFEYRKLIEILKDYPFSLFGHILRDISLCSMFGLYDKTPITIIADLYKFMLFDEHDKFIKVRLIDIPEFTHSPHLPLREGIQIITDYYVQSWKEKRNGLYPAHLDSEARIIEDFPIISEQTETDNIEFIKRYLKLICALPELESIIYEQIIYNAHIEFVIEKGENFDQILTSGSFIKNLKIPLNNFERSLYGKYGDYLLSFGKQIEIVRQLIKSKFKHFDINDIVITPQVPPEQRKPLNGTGDITQDASVRLLDCLFYLEYRNEIKFRELLPTRIVIDASGISSTTDVVSSSKELTCGDLTLDVRKCVLKWKGNEYKDIPIGNKSIKMLKLLLETPEELVRYGTIVKETEIIANQSFVPQVAQQYKNQLVKDLTKLSIPENIAIQIRDMIKSVNKEGYRITSN